MRREIPLALFFGMSMVGAAAETAPVASAPVSAPISSAVDIKSLRDPFRKPEFQSSERESQTDLEKYSVGDLKLVGVLTGPLRVRAMVVAPDGKTYYVAEKMKVGLRNGIVTRITTRSIQIQEKIVNALGETESVDSEILLPTGKSKETKK